MYEKKKLILFIHFYALKNISKSIITNMEETIIILMIAQNKTFNNIKCIIN